MVVITKFNNSCCIKCNAVNASMCHVGVFIMCVKCTKEEFRTEEDGSLKHSAENLDTYKKWLNKYKSFV